MPGTQNNILLVRQPIFNLKNQVLGYQLQYDDHQQLIPSCQSVKSLRLGAKLVINAFTCANEQALCDQLPIFISVSSALLWSGHLLSLPPKMVILDVTDTQVMTEDHQKTLQQYQKYQFRFAISLDQDNYQDHPLLTVADFIRLDIEHLGLATFAKLLRSIRHQGTNAKFIATNVNTAKQLKQCQAVATDLVQGHFISQPAMVVGKDLSHSQTTSLQLVGELQSPDITPARIAELLQQTPQLSYRLLRLINSVAFDLTRTIASLEEAVIYLGLNTVCHWVSLMVLADSSGKPKALVLSTLIRAKMNQLIAQKLLTTQKDKAFLVGLFSTLDAMLDIPLSQAITKLPLATDINEALLHHQGPLGEICAAVIAYEQAQFSQAKGALELPNYQLFIAYGEAVLWAKAIVEQF